MKRLFVNSAVSIVSCLLFFFTAQSQFTHYTSKALHAHNDYKQRFPFWEAYKLGYGSIEVDIFLHNNQLLVAHEESELDTSKTLEKLYLQPILQTLKNGDQKRGNLILLIDLKTEAEPTLHALITLLSQYPAIIEQRQIQLTITGNQPDPSKFLSYPSYLWFDANPDTNYPLEVQNRLAIMSANFKKFSKWNGKGVLSKEERMRLDSVIKKAEITSFKKMRFWNAPDIPNAWYQLMKLNVGLINTDNITEAATFMAKLPKNTFQLQQKQTTYTPTFISDEKKQLPKNIILLVADGMGLAHLHAGFTVNRGDLTIFKLRNTALSLTASFDSYITDSAPGATAFSSGEKTNNRSVGVDPMGRKLKLLPEYFASRNKKTAIITSGDLTDATPAAFYAHQSERTESLAILKDFLNSPVNILAGSGNTSIDSFLLKKQMDEVPVLHSIDLLQSVKTQKQIIADTMASKSVLKGRSNWLSKAFNKTVQALSEHKDGFMMMIEGAQVDYGGHANDLPYLVSEVLDFDQLVSAVLKFADDNKETLVIITADHETGGLTLIDGDIEKGYVSGHFSTTDHTGIPVPIFAYGPMSHLFNGIFQNTEIFHRIMLALGNRQ